MRAVVLLPLAAVGQQSSRADLAILPSGKAYRAPRLAGLSDLCPLSRTLSHALTSFRLAEYILRRSGVMWPICAFRWRSAFASRIQGGRCTTHCRSDPRVPTVAARYMIQRPCGPLTALLPVSSALPRPQRSVE